MDKRMQEQFHSNADKRPGEQKTHSEFLYVENGQSRKWDGRGGSWERETSLKGLLLPLTLLTGVIVAAVYLDIGQYLTTNDLGVADTDSGRPGGAIEGERPESAAEEIAGDESLSPAGPVQTYDDSTFSSEQENMTLDNLFVEEDSTDYVNTNTGVDEAVVEGGEAPVRIMYPAEDLLKYAHVPMVEIPVAEVKAKVKGLLSTVPLEDWQRDKLGNVVDEAVLLGLDESRAAVRNKMLISPDRAEIAAAENSIILVDARVRISSGSNNIVINSGYTRISAEGKRGGSLIVSKGKVSMAAAYNSTVYARGGLKISSPSGVVTFNTESLDGKDYNNRTIAPLFNEPEL